MKPLLLSTSVYRAVSLAIVFALLLYTVPFKFAFAATVTNASDTMSNLTINATSTHAIKFTSPTGANQNTDTIIITFPADFDFTGKVIGGLSFTHGATTGLETTEALAAAPSASDWGAVFSGTENRILTLTAPSDGTGAAVVAPNDRLIIGYTGVNSVNPSSAASYSITIGGAFGDTGEITVNILTDDQVVISATVPQSLTFSISDNSISFGNLNAASARYASGTAAGEASEVQAHNLIAGTNAANGYTMTVAGNTLTSGANTITAIGAANTASAAGTEQFGLRMTATGGSGTVSVPYAAAGFAFDSGAFPDQVATSVTSSANTTYSARYLANITSSTEAGSYTATLTYVATANF
jgi:hypothetical protein